MGDGRLWCSFVKKKTLSLIELKFPLSLPYN